MEVFVFMFFSLFLNVLTLSGRSGEVKPFLGRITYSSKGTKQEWEFWFLRAIPRQPGSSDRSSCRTSQPFGPSRQRMKDSFLLCLDKKSRIELRLSEVMSSWFLCLS